MYKVWYTDVDKTVHIVQVNRSLLEIELSDGVGHETGSILVGGLQLRRDHALEFSVELTQ